jgi:plastocyanin
VTVPKLASNSVGGPGVRVSGLGPILFATALAILPMTPATAVAQSSLQSASVAAGSAGEEPIPADVAGEPAATIKMSDNDPMYEPPNLVVQAGQIVEWKNEGDVSHSVTDDPTKALKPEDSLLPHDAKPFFSGNVMPGRAYRHTFLIPGRYRYFCLTHEVDKMIGEILVEPPGGPPPAHPGILGREAAPYAPAISINIPTPAAAPTQKPAYHSQPWRKLERERELDGDDN